MKKEESERRATGAGAVTPTMAVAGPLLLEGRDLRAAMVRRMAAAGLAAKVAWDRYREEKENMPLLRAYTRRLRRCAMLRDQLLILIEGGAR